MGKKLIHIASATLLFIILIAAISIIINSLQHPDIDSDGLEDIIEERIGSNPYKIDSDNDEIDDYSEYNYWDSRAKENNYSSFMPSGDIDYDGYVNINDEDSDNDGLLDGEEIKNGTDPGDPDTDNDGLSDAEEIQQGTDPLNPDTDQDGDGLSDKEEEKYGTNPNDPDTDNDGVSDAEEIQQGTDPLNPDTDGDGILDGEDINHTDGENIWDGIFHPIQGNNEIDRDGSAGNCTCYCFFNPCLSMGKRYIAYDSLFANNYTTYISDKNLNKIGLSNEILGDVFECSITLSELTDRPILIPSVSPNANILSYELSVPDLTVGFYKDCCDNYYIKSEKYNCNEKVRLKFKMSTSSDYYNLLIPDHLTLGDIPEDKKIILPSSTVEKASIIIDKLSLSDEQNFKKIVDVMYDYFSNFTEGKIPNTQEQPDTYLAIALSKHGRCVLRSFAFFVTANSIGIPCRLVTNECHAFVEIYVPTNGWKKIDLGGLGNATTQNPENYIFASHKNITITKINYLSSKTYKKGYFDVEGTVTDVRGNGISNINITIYVTKSKNVIGHKAGLGRTDVNGVFRIRCKTPDRAETGWNYVVAHSEGNKYYYSSTSDPVIDVYSNTTVLLDVPQKIPVNEIFNITGKLVDAGNQPLQNKQLKIYWNGSFVGDTTTNQNGVFEYKYTPIETGRFNLTIVYEGSNYLNPSNNSKIINVKYYNTKIMFNVSKSTVLRGEYIRISGKLTSNTNKEMSNIDLDINYNDSKLDTIKTSDYGAFNTELQIPVNSNLGNNTLEIHYKGDKEYAEATAKKSLFVKSRTFLIIDSPKKKQIERNTSITIKGVLTDNINNPIENKTINLSWTLGNALLKTNKSGCFTYQYNASTLGSIVITAVFKGNSHYLNSSYQKQINIVEPDLISLQKESQNTYILLLILVSVIITVIGILFLFRKEKEYHNHSIQQIARTTIRQLETGDKERDAVISCYKKMCDWLNQKGVKKGSYQTPREFALAVRNYLKIDPQRLYELTRIFEKARYSPHDIDLKDKEAAIELLREIMNAPLVNIDENTSKDSNE